MEQQALAIAVRSVGGEEQKMGIECGCGTRAQWTCPFCGGRIILVNNKPVCTLCQTIFAPAP
ncbi:MAG: hypothetical protein N2556_10375, partial [Anaerolineae bacterium]|nr:hypothetical protein [Anaerolineae bacterium]